MRQWASTAPAADLTQEAIAEAYSRWSEIRLHRPWVYTVAANALARWARQRREDPVEIMLEGPLVGITMDFLATYRRLSASSLLHA